MKTKTKDPIRLRIRIARSGMGRTVIRSTFGDWDDRKFHLRLRRTIHAQYPGWYIVGYVKLSPEEET